MIGGGLSIGAVSNSALATEQVHSEAIHEPTIPPKDIQTEMDLSQWMTYYYLSPQPALVPKAIFFIERQGLLDCQNAKASFVAFFSQIFAQNPTKLPAWIEELKALKQPHKNLVWSALWMANTAEAKGQMIIVAKQLMPNDQASIVKYTHKAVPIETMEISSPAILDMLWGHFFATGDERYVKRIMTVLQRSAPTEHNGESAIISGVAQWSLTCNARQHKRVLQICTRERDSQPALKTALSDVIDKATKPLEQSRHGRSIGEIINQDNKQISKHRLSAEEESSISNYNRLGFRALHDANYVEARRLFLSAKAIAEQASPEHPQLFKILSNLAMVYERMGSLALAEQLYKRAITVCAKSTSPNGKECGILHDNLGVVYLKMGTYTDAETHLKCAEEIFRQTCGVNSADLALNLGNLASLYRKEGDNTEAESMYKQGIAILEKRLFGQDDPELATALHNLADLYRAEGKYADAEPLYKRTLSIQEKALGPNHPYLIITLEHYADLLDKTNRKGESDQLLARARAIAAKQK